MQEGEAATKAEGFEQEVAQLPGSNASITLFPNALRSSQYADPSIKALMSGIRRPPTRRKPQSKTSCHNDLEGPTGKDAD